MHNFKVIKNLLLSDGIVWDFSIFLIHFTPSHIVFQLTLLSTFALVMLCVRCCLAGVSKMIRFSVWWCLHWGVVSAGKWIYL